MNLFKKNKKPKIIFYKICNNNNNLNLFDIVCSIENNYKIFNYTKEDWLPINKEDYQLKKISKFNATETLYYRDLALKKMLYQAKKIYYRTHLNLTENQDDFEGISKETQILRYLILADRSKPIDVVELGNCLFSNDIIMMFLIIRDTNIASNNKNIENPLFSKYIDELKITKTI